MKYAPRAIGASSKLNIKRYRGLANGKILIIHHLRHKLDRISEESSTPIAENRSYASNLKPEMTVEPATRSRALQKLCDSMCISAARRVKSEKHNSSIFFLVL